MIEIYKRRANYTLNESKKTLWAFFDYVASSGSDELTSGIASFLR